MMNSSSETKRNITAFLLALGGMSILVIVLAILVLIGVALGAALPYVLSALCIVGVAFVLSMPIRDLLKEREQRRINQSYESWQREQMRRNNKPGKNR